MPGLYGIGKYELILQNIIMWNKDKIAVVSESVNCAFMRIKL